MQSRAAVLHDVGREWSIEEFRLDPPGLGEVLVRLGAAGLCHSDEHLATGDGSYPNTVAEQRHWPRMFPMIGGHEGAGVVEAVGPGVTALSPGDHVVTSFVPVCGYCTYCSSGRTYLCDQGGSLYAPGQITDGTSRHWLGDVPLSFFCKVGCFAEHTVVAVSSVVKIDDDIPFPVAALVSCGVPTGWGSAVRAAETRPGDTVVVIGVGGIGINAVQGAAMVGARHVVAVEPLGWKRELALSLGATHAAATTEEATDLVRDITRGRMADAVVLTHGVMRGEDLQPAMGLVGKGGTCVVTSIAPGAQKSASLRLGELTTWSKQIRGALYGMLNPHEHVPVLLDLYRQGRLELDALVTRTYTLDAINEGYADLREGRNLRGVVVFD
jgi:NDMA-dependent alcohol dehydrogenase